MHFADLKNDFVFRRVFATHPDILRGLLNDLLDRRGEKDRCGRELQVTQVAIADGIAAAATLLMGEGAEGQPVVVARGLPRAWKRDSARAADLLRPLTEDLFR